MTPDQADALAARLKGMIPFMTDEQIRFWAQRFERYSLEAGQAAVERYVLVNSEIKNPVLTGLLEAEHFKRSAAGYARSQEKVVDARIARRTREVEKFIADFTDQDLQDLKPKALERLRGTLTDDAIKFVAKLDPRKSHLIKSAIYDLLKSAEAA